MPTPSEGQVLDALRQIVDPDLGRDVVTLGMIKDLLIHPDGKVGFTFELTTPACPVRDSFHQRAEAVVGAIPGVTGVDVKMTANVRAPFLRPQAAEMLPGVKHTIAVGSGKGGVGKSTVAVNLAASLSLTGAKVGILDADIYGPTIPGMTGTMEQPKVINEKLIPLQAYGMKLMSIGFLAGADKAMVWRGPMASRAIQQMMQDVDWGELDYLVLDLPPGTGDASLTVAQSIPLTGVAIVTTPQDVALEIAMKALQMFRSLNVTPLGLIENMSYFVCDECGKEHHIFSHGGAERAAERLSVPFLGALPLDTEVRQEADQGTPIVIADPESQASQAFKKIAEQVAAKVSIQSFRQLPVINVR